MRANVARRSVAYAGRNVIELGCAVGRDDLIFAPMPSRLLFTPINRIASQWFPPVDSFRNNSTGSFNEVDDINSPVVVVIGEGAAAMRAFGLKVGARFARSLPETSAACVCEEAVRLAISLIVVKLYVVV